MADYDWLRRQIDKEYDQARREHQNRKDLLIGALIGLLFLGFLSPQPISGILFFLAFLVFLPLLSGGPPDPNIHRDRHNEWEENKAPIRS